MRYLTRRAAAAPPGSMNVPVPQPAAAGHAEGLLLGRLTTALQWIFAAWVVFAGVGIGFRAMERSLLSRAAENRFSVSRAEALASDQRIDVFSYAEIAVYVATAIVFIVWFYCAYRRARALGGEMRYSDGWAIGGWFIPIGNWWIPKKLANDIWRGSDPDGDRFSWSERPALLTSWWVAWVGAGVSGWWAFRTGDVTDVDEGLVFNLAAIVSLALSLLAAVFAIFVVRQIGQRLSARAATFAAGLTADAPTQTGPSTPGIGAGLEATGTSGQRRQPWRLIGATVASVAIAVGTVVIVTGTSGTDAGRNNADTVETGGIDAGTSSEPVSSAPPILPRPAPSDFDRHQSHGDGFAFSVPSSWTGVDLTAPNIDSTLEQLRRTSPFITDYLDEQEQADARPSFFAVDTTPTGNAQAFPAQVEVRRIPNEGQSLDEGAQQLEAVVSGSPELVGTVDRKRIELPAGPAQVLSFKMRSATPVGDAVFAKTVYALISGDFAYVIALGVNENQAEASAPVFEAIIRSLEITK